MSNASDFSVGLAHEFTIAAAKAGFSPEEMVFLSKQKDLMQQLRRVVLGHAAIELTSFTIDCEADPYVPSGWEVVEHQRKGMLAYNPTRVKLHLHKKQKDGHRVAGEAMRRLMENQPVLNANVLDYLIANPHLVPEEWEDEMVFFWGTVYNIANLDGGKLAVRWLRLKDGEVTSHYNVLVNSWDSRSPAAVLMS